MEREVDSGDGTCYIKRSEDYRAGNKARLTGSLFSLLDTQHPLPYSLHIMPTCAYFIPSLIPFAPYRHTTHKSVPRREKKKKKK
jgi:hypothetical protein